MPGIIVVRLRRGGGANSPEREGASALRGGPTTETAGKTVTDHSVPRRSGDVGCDEYLHRLLRQLHLHATRHSRYVAAEHRGISRVQRQYRVLRTGESVRAERSQL